MNIWTIRLLVMLSNKAKKVLRKELACKLQSFNASLWCKINNFLPNHWYAWHLWVFRLWKVSFCEEARFYCTTTKLNPLPPKHLKYHRRWLRFLKCRTDFWSQSNNFSAALRSFLDTEMVVHHNVHFPPRFIQAKSRWLKLGKTLSSTIFRVTFCDISTLFYTSIYIRRFYFIW